MCALVTGVQTCALPISNKVATGDAVNRPIARLFRTISIIITIKGAARTPFTTAAQKRARTGSMATDVSAAPAKVVTAIRSEERRVGKKGVSTCGSGWVAYI